MKTNDRNTTAKSSGDDKIREGINAELAASFIRDGYLDPTGKTQGEFAVEYRKFLKENKNNILFVIDHTEDMLKQARVYRRQGKKELACLFYAMWFEHTLNGFVSSWAKCIDLADKEIEDIIRDTSYRAKCTWLPVLFGEMPFSHLQIKKIIKLMETRNSFVHYKWKVKSEQMEKEVEVILSDIEKTVKYVRGYENKYVIGISRRGVKKMIKRA